ncbi:hypothetical protein DPX16_19356 [Anabarilius grahami]|uniref:Uncharacterized protein n=1 Tax=Anabarilius grahami TaxID=495550 RepID=A0A3N0YZV8_ANAGA|nr:hypothetical protein DPX16_19356 [Anabarilius grahami]
MLKRLAAPASCSSCLLAFLLAFVSPRCTLSIGADKTMVNKEDYYSATVNATVLDHKGNPQQMVTKNDGRYGQNSPKTEAKGIVIAPAAVNGDSLPVAHQSKQGCEHKKILLLLGHPIEREKRRK